MMSLDETIAYDEDEINDYLNGPNLDTSSLFVNKANSENSELQNSPNIETPDPPTVNIVTEETTPQITDLENKYEDQKTSEDSTIKSPTPSTSKGNQKKKGVKHVYARVKQVKKPKQNHTE